MVMRVLEFITEGLFPFLLYCLFTWFLLSSSINAFKAVSRIKRESVAVTARVIGYSEKVLDSGAFKYKSYFVTVRCVHPQLGRELTHTLSTTSFRGRRYADLDETDVIYLSKTDDDPVLKEELRAIKRTRFIGLFGGLVCLAFCTLVVAAVLVKAITGKAIAEYF